jgi:DNA-binding GntR family transcriptional regulator
MHTGRTVATLREQIVSGELRPGTPLVETALAEALGVSRGPVRNALIELEGEGLVGTESNGRSMVVGFSQDDLRDLLAVRFESETLAITWGVERDNDPAPIGEILRAMVDEGRSTPDLIDLDLGFHRSIVEFAGSKALLNSWLRLAPIIHATITVGNSRLGVRDGNADFERIIRSHTPVFEAIAAGDAVGASKLLAQQFGVTAEMSRVDQEAD